MHRKLHVSARSNRVVDVLDAKATIFIQNYIFCRTFSVVHELYLYALAILWTWFGMQFGKFTNTFIYADQSTHPKSYAYTHTRTPTSISWLKLIARQMFESNLTWMNIEHWTYSMEFKTPTEFSFLYLFY